MMPLLNLLNQEDYTTTHSFNTLLHPLVVGYRFLPPKGVCLVIDDMQGEDTKRYTLPIQNKKITLYQLPQRYCTGSYSLLTMQSCPCPHKKGISGYRQKCNYCQKVTGFRKALSELSYEDIPSQQEAYNQLPHDVYLAYFIPGIVKVGIAYHHRLYSCLLEQGAQAALVIQESANAHEASMLAKEVTSLGIQKKVKANQKATWLAHIPYQSSIAKKQLIATREKLYEKLGERIVYTPTIYEFQYTYWPSGIPQYFSLGGQFPAKITGTVAGMVGSLLALYTSPTRCLVLETKLCLGKLLIELH